MKKYEARHTRKNQVTTQQSYITDRRLSSQSNPDFRQLQQTFRSLMRGIRGRWRGRNRIHANKNPTVEIFIDFRSLDWVPGLGAGIANKSLSKQSEWNLIKFCRKGQLVITMWVSKRYLPFGGPLIFEGCFRGISIRFEMCSL